MLTFTNPNTHMTQGYTLEPILASLENGGLVLLPTDTVWCVACDATNPSALSRLRRLRQLPEGQPLTLLAASIEQVRGHVRRIHPRVETLLAYHTRPLTLLYEQAKNLPAEAANLDGSVAFRIPYDDFCGELLFEFGRPIAATSACIGELPYPRHFGEVSSAIIEAVDLVVRYRQMDKEMEPPAVIARIGEDEELEFLRE